MSLDLLILGITANTCQFHFTGAYWFIGVQQEVGERSSMQMFKCLCIKAESVVLGAPLSGPQNCSDTCKVTKESRFRHFLAQLRDGAWGVWMGMDNRGSEES